MPIVVVERYCEEKIKNTDNVSASVVHVREISTLGRRMIIISVPMQKLTVV